MANRNSTSITTTNSHYPHITELKHDGVHSSPLKGVEYIVMNLHRLSLLFDQHCQLSLMVYSTQTIGLTHDSLE